MTPRHELMNSLDDCIAQLGEMINNNQVFLGDCADVQPLSSIDRLNSYTMPSSNPHS